MDAIVKETNLQRILREKNISTEAVKAVIGCATPKSALMKIRRECQFKLSEAKTLHQNLLPEYDFDYLFREYYGADDTDEDPGQQAEGIDPV